MISPDLFVGKDSVAKDVDTECQTLFRECLTDKDFCDLALEYINDQEITQDLRMKMTDGEYEELVKGYATDTAFHDLLKLGKPQANSTDIKLQYMNFRNFADLIKDSMNEPDFLELMKECLRENADSRKTEGNTGKPEEQNKAKVDVNKNNSSKRSSPAGTGRHLIFLFFCRNINCL